MHEGRFRHELLQYTDGTDGFVKQTLPHVSRALAAQEPILIAVASENVAALKEALGDDAERVAFADMQTLGRNPGRIISAWREFLASHAVNGDGALGIGEPIWPGRSAAELTECHRHEALLNLAFDGGQPWHLLCPYDVDGLDDQVIEAAQHSHPFVAESDGNGRAETDVDRRSGEAHPFEGALPAPLSADVHQLPFTADQLGALRHFLSQWSADQLLSTDATQELVLAVNELATNSIRYGGGCGTMLAWRERDELMCEIKDAGHIQDPLIGRSRPGPDQHTGRGLWLVNQLCDLVQIRSSPEGTAVRVHKARTPQTG
ncbi:MAG: anti-sigma factor RsbA family regulatory protein [Solirubrobacteraceae bacterium]